MQLPILAVLTCLVAWVAADGVRNGYERVWLWYAYQIDLTLPAAQQQIGKKCIKWDVDAHLCPDTYQPTGKKGKPVGPRLPNTALCKGTAPGGSCYFWEFMGHIDGKTYVPKNMWLLPTTNTNDLDQQKNLKPDPKATAEWLSVQHGTTTFEKANNVPRAVKYPPFKVWQGVGEVYNDMLNAVGHHSATTVAGLSAAQRAIYKDQLDGLKLSLKSTIIEREIDHATHVVKHANEKGFTLAKRTELGYTGDIVDWEGTKALHTSEAFYKFYNDFYYFASDAPDDKDIVKASKTAREHLQVMGDFRAVEGDIIACGV